MDTEQPCLGEGPSLEQVNAFQNLLDSLQHYSTKLQGWFVLPNWNPDIIQLCTSETNYADSQHLKTISAKNSCGRQWHPLIIKLCLYIHHISSKAYETTHNSGIINLPSSRTLQNYQHLEHAKIGFSNEVDR